MPKREVLEAVVTRSLHQQTGPQMVLTQRTVLPAKVTQPTAQTIVPETVK